MVGECERKVGRYMDRDWTEGGRGARWVVSLVSLSLSLAGSVKRVWVFVSRAGRPGRSIGRCFHLDSSRLW